MSDLSNETEHIPVDLRTARKQFSRLGMGGFIILVTANLLQFVIALVFYLLFPNKALPSWFIWFASFVPLYLVAIPIGVLIMRKAPATPLKKSSLRPGQIVTIVCICYFVAYAGNIFGIILLALLRKILGIATSNPLDSYIMSGSVWLKILVMAILAPMLEEYVFRKQLIDRMHIYGEKLAVFTSALLFGLFHGNLSQFFYAFTIGLVFGYVYLKTGKLRYSIGLHMLINFLSVIALLLVSDIDNLLNLLLIALYAMFILGVFIAGCTLLCVKRRSIHFEPTELELPKGTRFKTVFLNAGMILLVVACLLLIVMTFF